MQSSLGTEFGVIGELVWASNIVCLDALLWKTGEPPQSVVVHGGSLDQTHSYRTTEPQGKREISPRSCIEKLKPPSLPEATERHMKKLTFLGPEAVQGIRNSLVSYYAKHKEELSAMTSPEIDGMTPSE